MMARCAHVMVEHPVSSETRFIRTAAAFYVGPTIWSSSTHGPAAHVGVRAIKWMAGCSSNLFFCLKNAPATIYQSRLIGFSRSPQC